MEPTAPLTISAPEVLDTDLSPRCVTTTSVTGDGDYCVVAATSISIEAELRATGTRPLVLLAVDSITTTARIDVGSRRGPDPEVGAGADSAACGLGTPPEPGGGGAGGSFASSGGPGGASFGGDGGVPEAPVSSVTILRGGCRGQDGEGQLQIGSGGHGGGAVFLFAGTRIDVKEGINAAGEGGAGGAPGDDFPVGGGGGGSGGMIGLDAPTITCSGVLLATGGGGGGGNDGFLSRSGMPGSDPVTTARAPGGEGPQRGGDGGDGSISADIGGEAGDRGLDQLGGGGGGGGGAGIIKVPASVTLGCEVAPAPTP